MINPGLEEAQAGIKIAGRNINNLRYADDTSLMAESEEELKSLLMKVKVESEKVGLKLNIQKMKIMSSGPITSWQIDRETMETVRDFILGNSKIIADGDCSHEIKRRLLLGRKAVTNLDSMLKRRDITLPAKVHLVKDMVCPVVMCGCGEGNGSPLQHSCLENPMDGGAWWAAVHGVAKSRTRLSDFTFTFHFHALEKEMATHSSVLAWRIPGMGEPGGLPSMGLHRVTTEVT